MLLKYKKSENEKFSDSQKKSLLKGIDDKMQSILKDVNDLIKISNFDIASNVLLSNQFYFYVKSNLKNNKLNSLDDLKKFFKSDNYPIPVRHNVLEILNPILGTHLTVTNFY